MASKIFQPKWARKMPIHLRPSAYQVATIESLRKRLDVPHDEFHIYIMGHPKITEKSLRHMYQMAKAMEPGELEQTRLAHVLLERATHRAMAGVTTFGIDFDSSTEGFEEQALRITSPFRSIGELAAWISQKEDAIDPVFPPAPEYEWVEKEITNILSK
jgi:hypothetical protein